MPPRCAQPGPWSVAIEAASGYERYRHGRSGRPVGGVRLSGADELRKEVRDLLDRHTPAHPAGSRHEVEAVVTATALDKKRTADGVGFGSERPGEPAVSGSTRTTSVLPEELRAE
jgi:hypothetical protein